MENKFFRLQHLKARLKRFIPIPFLMIAFALLMFNARGGENNTPLSALMSDMTAPIYRFVQAPLITLQTKWQDAVSYLDLYEENKRLKAQNQLLIAWKNTALRLAYEQKEMARLLNYTPIAPSKEYVVRILSDYKSPFSHSVILMGGKSLGLKKGNVLLTNQGLYGRIISVNETSSRALKLTDYYSRLPVLVGKNQVLCMLSGDNTDQPKLISIPEEAEIQEGDYVMSAGNAGVYPSGIGIGVIQKNNNEYSVDLFEKTPHLEFVRVVDFGLDGILSDEEKVPQ